MAYKDPEVRLQRDRERFRKRTAERVAQGLCPRCGDRAPAPERSVCDPCAEKRNKAILVHGGGPGVERIAAQWADRNGVHQIVCKPDWDRHGRAAPFRRNEELLNLLPKGVIAFPGSGITENLVDKARQLGIPVMRAA